MKKRNRSVSIIGVGDSYSGRPTSPEMKDTSYHEWFTYACHEAMKDANVNPQEIDEMVFSNVFMPLTVTAISQHVHLAEWIGMRGKPAYHIESACASSYMAVEQAINDIASGRCDIVIACGVELGQDFIEIGKPAYMLHSLRQDVMGANDKSTYPWPGILSPGQNVLDPGYVRFNPATQNHGGSVEINLDYMKKTGITIDQLDDALNHVARNTRYNASLNPKAFLRKTFDELAKENGYGDDVWGYMKDEKFNPHHSYWERNSQGCCHTNLAGAVILCATDLAKKYVEKPIEILGSGIACRTEGDMHHLDVMNVDAINMAYEEAGIPFGAIDYLQCTDMFAIEQILTAEECGYIPEGEAWKYALEDRTAIDGDKPINTNGGDLFAGHAFGTAGFPMYAETVRQMRGECGERQLKKIPKTALVRGMGGSHTTTATILRTIE